MELINIFILLLKISCISLVITQFEPLTNLKRWIFGFKKKDTLGWLIFELFHKITSCAKCFTFWFSLSILSILGFDLYSVITLTCIATIQSQVLYKISQTFFIK